MSPAHRSRLARLPGPIRLAALRAVASVSDFLAALDLRLRGAPTRPPQSDSSAPSGIHARRWLDVLLGVNLTSARTLDPDRNARAALDALIRVLGADRALLLWHSELNSILSLRVALGADGVELADIGRFDTELVDLVRAERRPLRHASGGEKGWAGSALAAPLLIGGRLAGVVYVDSQDTRAAFTDEDVVLLQAIANHVAIAIETARVAQLEVHVAAERAQRRLTETLASVSIAITSTLDLDEVLNLVLENLALVVPYDSASVLLREAEYFRVVGVRGLSDAVAVRRLILPSGDALLAEVQATRRPVTVADARSDPRYLGYGGTDYTRSWMGVPLLAGEDVIGVLALDSRLPAAYGDAEAQISFTFAGQAAIAIRNARLYGEVSRLAATDALTGVLNRHRFFELAESEWETSRRLGRPLAAMMLDIDDFKRVNDTYGHAMGDAVLVGVAERCQTALREGDILGRYGGEEFAVVLPATDLEAARSVAERLRVVIGGEPLRFSSGAIAVTVSVGVVADREPDTGLASLLNRADEALYAAKGSGRNCVVVGGE